MSTDFETEYDGPTDGVLTFSLKDELKFIVSEYTYLVRASQITDSAEFILNEESSYIFKVVCGDESFYYPEDAPAVITYRIDNE